MLTLAGGTDVVRPLPSTPYPWWRSDEAVDEEAVKHAILDTILDGSLDLAAVQEHHGAGMRDWAHAMQWAARGSDREDEAGWASWIRTFGTTLSPWPVAG